MIEPGQSAGQEAIGSRGEGLGQRLMCGLSGLLARPQLRQLFMRWLHPVLRRLVRRAPTPRVRGVSVMIGLLAACSVAGAQERSPESAGRGPWPLEERYEIEGRSIHYVSMPGRGPDRILFIHGSPGRWQAWADYLRDPRLRALATLVAPDRPGFGESGPGRVITDLGRQAQMLEPLLRRGKRHGRTLIVGHSYGGTIAARMAMDYPSEIAGVVLIAPAIDPRTEYPSWYDIALESGPLRWLAPASLDWSTDEIRPLNPQLQAMRKRWAQLKVPVLLIQGTDDREVDPRTAEFAEQVLPPGNRVLRVRNAGHHIIWHHEDLVRDNILQMLQQPSVASTAANPGLAAPVPGAPG